MQPSIVLHPFLQSVQLCCDTAHLILDVLALHRESRACLELKFKSSPQNGWETLVQLPFIHIHFPLYSLTIPLGLWFGDTCISAFTEHLKHPGI